MFPECLFFFQLKFIISTNQSLQYSFLFCRIFFIICILFPLFYVEQANFFFACYMLLLLLFLFSNTQMINRALLANQRAIAKLFLNLMESEMKRELSQRSRWQDRVEYWKLIQKNRVVHSFRSEVLQLCSEV